MLLPCRGSTGFAFVILSHRPVRLVLFSILFGKTTSKQAYQQCTRMNRAFSRKKTQRFWEGKSPTQLSLAFKRVRGETEAQKDTVKQSLNRGQRKRNEL